MITLIRHGQAGSRQVYDELSGIGHEQALALGEWLAGRGVRFDRVVSGALNRQRQTAAVMLRAMGDAPSCQSEEDPRWDEFDLDAVYAGIGPALAAHDAVFRAEFEALQSEVADPLAAAHREWRRCDAIVVRAWIEGRPEYGGESFTGFSARVQAAFLELPAGESVAVVTSATPIAVCAGLSLELGPRRVMQLAGAQHNTGYSEMDPRPGDPRLVSFNNTPHLSAGHRTYR